MVLPPCVCCHRYMDAVLEVRSKNPRLKAITFLYASYEPRYGSALPPQVTAGRARM